MGGYGSGDWQSWNAKPLVERCRSLDVRLWCREGRLYPGADFSTTWFNRDGKLASMGVRVGHDQLSLQYQYQYHQGDNDWEAIRDSIPLTWTPCNYGGRRPWFQCHGTVNRILCGRRVVKLYQRGRYFRCRTCHGLVYSAQRVPIADRPRERAGRIRMRLGGSPSIFAPFPPKPKGMHWKTYWRLEDKSEEAEREFLGIMRESISRLRANYLS